MGNSSPEGGTSARIRFCLRLGLFDYARIHVHMAVMALISKPPFPTSRHVDFGRAIHLRIPTTSSQTIEAVLAGLHIPLVGRCLWNGVVSPQSSLVKISLWVLSSLNDPMLTHVRTYAHTHTRMHVHTSWGI